MVNSLLLKRQRHRSRSAVTATVCAIFSIGVLALLGGCAHPSATGPVLGSSLPEEPSAVLAPLPQASSATVKPAAEDSTQLIKLGKRVYGITCARCHGVDMVNTGGSTFDLRTFPLDDKSRFVSSVLHGKGAMPAWEGVVTAEEVEALWAYVSAR